jgi:hypothetical protein
MSQIDAHEAQITPVRTYDAGVYFEISPDTTKISGQILIIESIKPEK